MIRRVVATLSTLILFTASAGAQVLTQVAAGAERRVERAADRESQVAMPSAEIARARDAYIGAMNAADLDKLTPLYAEDAIVIPDTGVFLRGQGEIHRYFANTLRQSSRTAVKFRPVTAVTTGDLGSESGSFEQSRTTAVGTQINVSGLYVTIYTRGRDGQWRIAMEVRTTGGLSPSADRTP